MSKLIDKSNKSKIISDAQLLAFNVFFSYPVKVSIPSMTGTDFKEFITSLCTLRELSVDLMECEGVGSIHNPAPAAGAPVHVSREQAALDSVVDKQVLSLADGTKVELSTNRPKDISEFVADAYKRI